MESLTSTHLFFVEGKKKKKALLSFTDGSSNVMQHVTSYFLLKGCSVCTRSSSKVVIIYQIK